MPNFLGAEISFCKNKFLQKAEVFNKNLFLQKIEILLKNINQKFFSGIFKFFLFAFFIFRHFEQIREIQINIISSYLKI